MCFCRQTAQSGAGSVEHTRFAESAKNRRQRRSKPRNCQQVSWYKAVSLP